MPITTIWPVKPIHNASDVKLNQQPGTLPNMSDTVANWFQLVIMERIVKTIVNFQVVEITTPMQFQGVVMTDPKRTLKMTPEGQRRWKVKTLYCWPTLQLSPDDVVIYESTQYRIGASLDFKQYGYMAYEMIEDYTGSGPETT